MSGVRDSQPNPQGTIGRTLNLEVLEAHIEIDGAFQVLQCSLKGRHMHGNSRCLIATQLVVREDDSRSTADGCVHE